MHLAKRAVYRRNKDSRGPTPRACTGPLSPIWEQKGGLEQAVSGEPERGTSPPVWTAASPRPAMPLPPWVQVRAQRSRVVTLPASPTSPASPLARRLRWACPRLHGNRTQTTYPGRRGRLPAVPGRCWAGGTGQEMNWEGAQGKGLPASPKPLWLALVTVTAAEVQLILELSPCGGRRGAGRVRRSGAGLRGVGRGPERRDGGLPASLGHWACAGHPQSPLPLAPRACVQVLRRWPAGGLAGGSWASAASGECACCILRPNGWGGVNLLN